MISKNYCIFCKIFYSCEKRETIEQCAQREIEEECGIKGLQTVRKITETYHTYILKGKPVLKRTYWYLFNYAGNEKPIPQTEEEITEVMWVSGKEVGRLLTNTFQSIIDVVKLYKELY